MARSSCGERVTARPQSLLERFPPVLDALVRPIPPELVEADEGAGTWTVREVVAHLAQTEQTDWMSRVRLILKDGESTPFPRVDRAAFKREAAGKSAAELLDAFASQRERNLVELAGLQLSEADLDKRGVHPAFGPVTLAQLLATWATHDINHLHQITRIIANQYRSAVGPWTAFLGVMHCNGHSEAPR